FFEKDDDLQTFLVFLYLIMCIEFLIIRHGDSLLEYPEYKNSQEVPDLALLYFYPELEPTFGFMSESTI
ncbi:MAG: hypothetical protein NZ850_09395, partial [Caldimicrobium sp.]|nr:hypothetical protein [Caldimicrobium sp.]